MYRDELLKLGYTEEEIWRIRNSLCINTYREDTIYSKAIDNFRFFLELGYSDTEIIRMSVKYPKILVYSYDYILNKK